MHRIEFANIVDMTKGMQRVEKESNNEANERSHPPGRESETRLVYLVPWSSTNKASSGGYASIERGKLPHFNYTLRSIPL